MLLVRAMIWARRDLRNVAPPACLLGHAADVVAGTDWPERAVTPAPARSARRRLEAVVPFGWAHEARPAGCTRKHSHKQLTRGSYSAAAAHRQGSSTGARAS